ncbi:hypothetical protein [Clostridium estertheticum]|uniref:hypothetical protein n=1 Tax=Clostridium estertheticum TaxID=238834 RepID=UPI001CF114F9|nr:hypothetical protein [Clostridium estertheticum]MCB2342413.1 hypothetical protein [Clostridium estertheticum]
MFKVKNNEVKFVIGYDIFFFYYTTIAKLRENGGQFGEIPACNYLFEENDINHDIVNE